MEGFDLLGAESPAYRPPWKRTGISLIAGALGAYLVPKHPVLGFLNGAALASNVLAVGTEERSWQDALRRLGKHVVATAGSLAMPKHPAIGYVAGAVAGDLLLDGAGGGIVEEWAHYAGVPPKQKGEVIDAQVVEDTALAKVK